MELGSKIRVGIIRGGEGSNYDQSIEHGGEILSYLHENLADKFKAVDILIDPEGVWHIQGLPIMPADLVHKIDVAWNTSGHDASVILDNIGIPYVGKNPVSSIFENNRSTYEEHLKKIGVNIPKHLVLPIYQKDFDKNLENYARKMGQEVFAKFGAPWTVRSYVPDKNLGIYVAKTYPELISSVYELAEKGKSILVEELIPGQEISMHSLSGFRGQHPYVFPLVKFAHKEKDTITRLAEDLHSHLDASHYLNSNFVINPNRGIFLTSISFIPDFSPDSHFYSMCEAVGAKPHHIIEHIINIYE
jgi:D-alanine-D-alanine ligase-like ATP-grasp enzyme